MEIQPQQIYQGEIVPSYSRACTVLWFRYIDPHQNRRILSRWNLYMNAENGTWCILEGACHQCSMVLFLISPEVRERWPKVAGHCIWRVNEAWNQERQAHSLTVCTMTLDYILLMNSELPNLQDQEYWREMYLAPTCALPILL